jgi:hypothetical protein
MNDPIRKLEAKGRAINCYRETLHCIQSGEKRTPNKYGLFSYDPFRDLSSSQIHTLYRLAVERGATWYIAGYKKWKVQDDCIQAEKTKREARMQKEKTEFDSLNPIQKKERIRKKIGERVARQIEWLGTRWSEHRRRLNELPNVHNFDLYRFEL